MPKNGKALLCMAIFIALGVMAAWPGLASAEPFARQAEVLQYQVAGLEARRWKSKSVINFWNHRGRWALHIRHGKCWQVQGNQRRKVCKKARQSLRFHQSRLPSLEARIEKLEAPHDTGFLPPARAVVLGQKMAARVGWAGTQWNCLKQLWGHLEGGWYVYADNPTSSAYGIPQALPGSKMGVGWRNSAFAQIKWGLGYVRAQYGTPCSALSTRLAKGWY